MVDIFFVVATECMKWIALRIIRDDTVSWPRGDMQICDIRQIYMSRLPVDLSH